MPLPVPAEPAPSLTAAMRPLPWGSKSKHTLSSLGRPVLAWLAHLACDAGCQNCVVHTISQPEVSSRTIWSVGELRLTAVMELLSQVKSSLKLVSVVFLGGRPGGVIFSRSSEIADSLASPQVMTNRLHCLPS